MRQTRTMLWAAAICLTGLAAGCGDKKITFIYANVTSDTVTVTLVEHEVEKVPIRVPADGQVSDRRTYDRDFLPITYILRVGKMESDSFTIDEDTADKLWFIIQPNKIIGPVKKGDRVDSGWQIELDDKSGHTIVE